MTHATGIERRANGQASELRHGRGNDFCFQRRIPGIGFFALRPLRLPDDGALVHGWVTEERARFWNMIDKSRAEVETFYAKMIDGGHATALIGLVNGEPAFLVESYDPAHDQIADHYPVERGDHGMHFLVAPATRRISGYSVAVISTILDYLFSDERVCRIVVEPDVRNEKIHVLNKRVGFVYAREIQLREKRAHLAFCTRDQFTAATIRGYGR